MKMWIARDLGGELVLYDRKPYKKDNYWGCDDKCDFMPMNDRLFPEVTFDNSPQEVELVIKK